MDTHEVEHPAQLIKTEDVELALKDPTSRASKPVDALFPPTQADPNFEAPDPSIVSKLTQFLTCTVSTSNSEKQHKEIVNAAQLLASSSPDDVSVIKATLGSLPIKPNVSVDTTIDAVVSILKRGNSPPFAQTSYSG